MVFLSAKPGQFIINHFFLVPTHAADSGIYSTLCVLFLPVVLFLWSVIISFPYVYAGNKLQIIVCVVFIGAWSRCHGATYWLAEILC